MWSIIGICFALIMVAAVIRARRPRFAASAPEVSTWYRLTTIFWDWVQKVSAIAGLFSLGVQLFQMVSDL